MSSHLECTKGCKGVNFETKSYYIHYQIVDSTGDFVDEAGEDYTDGSGEFNCAECGAAADWVEDVDEEYSEHHDPLIIDTSLLYATLPVNSPFEVLA